MNQEIKVRFAPSPTGFLHIGGVRTALFNWLFARSTGGKFILRIEDTDQDRSTDESIREIIESMLWLGLNWDEGPYRQTQRQDLYRSKIDELFKEDKAYRCYCSPEDLEQRKKEAMKKGLKAKYDGRCRSRTDCPDDQPHVIRFRSPEEGSVVVDDLLRGKVVFDNKELDDMILLRSDGSPTYNFVVVVDDAEMGITHVIRGDDHLSNTPRQALLFDALGYTRPKFAHISMILGEDKTRLSKRHGATSALAYRDMGYLPQALINYLVRLGWSHGDQEIFSQEEMFESFSLESITTSAAVFNPEKLSWLNQHYLKTLPIEEIAERWKPILVKENIFEEKFDSLIDAVQENPNPKDMIPIPDKLASQNFEAIILALRERSKTLVEMAQASEFYFKEDLAFDEKAKNKFLKPEVAPLLEMVVEELSHFDDFTEKEAEIESIVKGIVEKEGLKLGKLAQPIRVALTGKTVSPGIYDVITLLGRTRTLKRLNEALDFIKTL
jgi:glutamyl-tRNA synthetase